MGDTLQQIDVAAGERENETNAKMFQVQLQHSPSRRVDLQQAVSLLKRTPAELGDVAAFSSDYYLLLVRIRRIGKGEGMCKYTEPIPWELLTISETEKRIPALSNMSLSAPSTLTLLARRSITTILEKRREEYPIIFCRPSQPTGDVTLYAPTQAARTKWIEFIGAAQKRLRARSDFNIYTIFSNLFTDTNKVNCATRFNCGRKLLLGTDNGIYLQLRNNKGRIARQVLEATNVSQVDVIEDYQMLLVLANNTLQSYLLLGCNSTELPLTRGPDIVQNRCEFFKTGHIRGRNLVCCVKTSNLLTQIRVLEPEKTPFSLAKGARYTLARSQDIYLPTRVFSIHFLQSKLCVACSEGFKLISLDTFESHKHSSPGDKSLGFITHNSADKPVHIECVDGNLLLNYSGFSLFVDSNGQRVWPQWRVDWEGVPQTFVVRYPWILAFEPNFVEFRNLESGVVRFVSRRNIRFLHGSRHEILFSYEDSRGVQNVGVIEIGLVDHLLAPTMPTARP